MSLSCSRTHWAGALSSSVMKHLLCITMGISASLLKLCSPAAAIIHLACVMEQHAFCLLYSSQTLEAQPAGLPPSTLPTSAASSLVSFRIPCHTFPNLHLPDVLCMPSLAPVMDSVKGKEKWLWDQVLPSLWLGCCSSASENACFGMPCVTKKTGYFDSR